MQTETELISIFIFFTLIALVLLSGIFFFIFQYRKRKMQHQSELLHINQQHMEDLLSTQLKIQQQTMEDIGREIHDNVGQRLTLASIYSQQLALQNSNSPKLIEINKIIVESLDELRSLSKTLTNDSIENIELISQIEWECNRIKKLGVSEVHFSHQHLPQSISANCKTFIIRIIQEFSQNSLKHAACSNIYIRLTGEENGILFMLSDDGKGFDISQTYTGIGLQNMQNRAKLLNATFKIESQNQQGTQLYIFIPAY